MSVVEAFVTTSAAVQVTVVIPTFREAENLPVIVPRVVQSLQEHDLNGEILIVDDDSRDGTEEVCRELAKLWPVRLITRRGERGLSSAVLRGMSEALGDVLVVMDADLSHPPEKVPELIETLDAADVDFVIGSRYVAGGDTDGRWGLLRWLNSRAATLLARPFTSARDPMAGFFALRRETFRRAEELNPVGYKIGLELLVKCGCRRVHEVPIFFHQRLHGESKLSWKEQLNYLRHLARLAEYRLRHLPRLPKFVAVGVSGSVVDLAVFAAIMLILPVPAARAIAIWAAMTWNFYWNRRWTFFESRQESIARQYALFCLACLLGAAVSWSVSVGLWRYVPMFTARPLLAAILGVVAGTAFNFAASCRFVFRRSPLSLGGHGR
jgi:dolichol-phosphate mannosyltransferase